MEPSFLSDSEQLGLLFCLSLSFPLSFTYQVPNALHCFGDQERQVETSVCGVLTMGARWKLYPKLSQVNFPKAL